jgi:hypothetical protein
LQPKNKTSLKISELHSQIDFMLLRKDFANFGPVNYRVNEKSGQDIGAWRKGTYGGKNEMRIIG